MKSTSSRWLVATVTSLFFASCSLAHPVTSSHILRRSEITQDELLESYDFVIVGGGQAGVVIGSRLSENEDVKVLIVEYGYFNNDPAHLEPTSGTVYFPQDLYNMTSAPQKGLNGAEQGIYAAAVVGGGSTVNGMMLNRGSAADYDSWEALGNEGWGWDGLLPYFVKSSRFDSPAPEAAEEFNMTWGEGSYGDGPIHQSFSSFQWPGIKIQREGIIEAGVELQADGSDGHAYGVIWYPTALDNTTAIRSYAVNGYYEPASKRPNLHVLTGWRVDNVIFDDEKKATGVALTQRDVSGSGDVPSVEIGVDLEVVVTAGALHSPQVLQRSGVGPSWLLEKAGIDVVADLPGVGSNLQDHATATAGFNYTTNVSPNPEAALGNATFQEWAKEQLQRYRSGPLRIATGNTGGEIPLTTVDPDGSEAIAGAYLAQDVQKYLPQTYTEEQIAGYEAIREELAGMLTSDDNAWLELPLTGMSTFSTVLIKGVGRGTVLLDPEDIYADPIVDYYTLVNPIDVKIMTSNLRFVRKYHKTEAMQQLGPVENVPGTNVTTDEQIEDFLRASARSSVAHSAGSCAMMPQELGGVVDAELNVYGVTGVSVADSSIMPIVPGAHTCATVYAIAEKAADIIKQRHNLGE